MTMMDTWTHGRVKNCYAWHGVECGGRSEPSMAKVTDHMALVPPRKAAADAGHAGEGVGGCAWTTLKKKDSVGLTWRGIHSQKTLQKTYTWGFLAL